MRIPFEHTYAALAPRFSVEVAPTRVASPRLIRLNRALAARLGLDVDALDSPLGAEIFGGNVVAEGARPIALAYAGHQFGHFVPQLGDGRAILLGELRDEAGGRFDVQLKGAGPTPFSRRGDGRAALGPVLREYLLSEAMAALGVPTTRALAAVGTGEPVFRETALPGAVITRVAASHVRVGTFQFFAARRDLDALRLLADHVIARHYPALEGGHAPGDGARYVALLEAVAERHASLVAVWLSIGFVHGVMNTDNTQIAGETLDYGPCAFLDAYDPRAVFSSIDHAGRYAYANQPRVAQWNLARFAETLLPLMGDDEPAAVAQAEQVLARFGERFDAAYLDRMRRKLGLAEPYDGDLALLEDLLSLFARAAVDFTNGFRALSSRVEPGGAADAPVDALPGGAALEAWEVRYRARLAREGRDPAEVRRAMDATNPAVIPRNHLVEAVIRAAVDRDDLAPFDALATELERPFDARPACSPFTTPPRPEERVTQTFCGT